MIYANENDTSAAHWLSKLPIRIDRIDARSIADVRGDDLGGFTQCHFFAGIAGWPLALQMAGWPDDAAVWNGSCPCQPFSGAGKRKGTADERHLWPEFARLIDECRPATIFGEQVASKDGRNWLATVRADLEALGYAVGAADLCAAGVGAPHIRQRLFWVAYRDGNGFNQRRTSVASKGHDGPGRNSSLSWMADGYRERRETRRGDHSIDDRNVAFPSGTHERLADCESHIQRRLRKCRSGNGPIELPLGRHGGHRQWTDAEYIPCRDGKARPVKPGLRCLAHGIPGRVAQLRGLGNAIVPQVAAEFVAAFMDTMTAGGDA